MRKELEKNYNPKIVEDRLYKHWLDKRYFHAEVDESKTPYTIVIPPPNITAVLHLGHALNNTIQDILIRAKRMQGYNALWLPGTDHANIATEAKIVEALAEEGLSKKEIGREAFMERAWAWKAKYAGAINEQLKKLGISCDWERERFTLDETITRATMEVFVNLYRKGYIYRGVRLVNWCTKCKTSISDAEVEHEQRNGFYYHMKYPINGTNDFLQFVTSRPETILGDTAIAVNPDDERYTHLVGKTVTVPIVNRVIPIISDFYVDKSFGTGVVKVTPAHDPNDFEIGIRHNLPKINVLNDDGTINENGGAYEGLDRYEARKKIIEEFTSLGLFVREEAMTNSVGEHDRCHTTVEPLLKLQWFVKMEEMSKPAADAYRNGELNIFPERFGKVYLNWLDNIKDWCISRQLWWGHRIPAWHCADCGHITVAATTPNCCEKCGSTAITQDEDCLDTWFSSALWPFATLGWPEQTPEFKHFYPTNVLVTAYEILFFWVVRMVFSGIEQTGKLPFNDVIFHGVIRDFQGVKFSKSLGNGIDPLDVIKEYGADALRLTLMTGNSLGNDMRFYYERVETSRNFLNKLWNATRFMLMNFDEDEPTAAIDELTAADKWILSKVNTLAKEVADNLDSYDLGVAVQKIHDFIWDEFCDWYIEMVKPRLYNRDDVTRNAALWTLQTTLIHALKLLHPFMPFITEEIFTSIQSAEETIVTSSFPVYNEAWSFSSDEHEISIIKEAVKSLRYARAEMNVPPSRKARLTIVCEDETTASIFEKGRVYLNILAFASDINIALDKTGINNSDIPVIVPQAVIYMPLSDLVDIQKELQRLTKEKIKLQKEVDRVISKLSNDGFVSKAPQKVIDEERQKQTKYEAMLSQVEQQINKLS